MQVIVQAEAEVRQRHELDETTPLIIMGGRGFIGRRLMKRFHKREIYCVDIAGKLGQRAKWPQHLHGQNALLLNVSRRAVLSDYLPQLWAGMILLNEVYPEPEQDCLEQLAAKGIVAYHVAGVAGTAYPPFPGAYAGGIPACAACLTPEMRVLIRRLN